VNDFSAPAQECLFSAFQIINHQRSKLNSEQLRKNTKEQHELLMGINNIPEDNMLTV